MPRFRNVAASALTMQFGREKPIELQPGEIAEVHDKWAGLVFERGYKVERVEDDFGETSEEIANLLVSNLAERVEALLAFIRSAPSHEELERVFQENRDLEDCISDIQRAELGLAATKRLAEIAPPPPAQVTTGTPPSDPAVEDSEDEGTDGESEETAGSAGETTKKARKARKKKPEGDGTDAG